MSKIRKNKQNTNNLSSSAYNRQKANTYNNNYNNE